MNHARVRTELMSHTSSSLSSIPVLGSGLGYRRELKAAIFESRADIDFVEVVTEQFFGDARYLADLEELCQVFPVIPHGVGLSIGSVELDEAYLRAIKVISDTTRSPYYSEHLAMTRAPGIDIGHLSPVWFTEAVLRTAIDNVSRVQDTLGKPLVVENVTYLFEIPGATMKQAEFFGRLVEATGAGILLDLTNLYTNSVNHGFDPEVFLDELPLDKVVQIHLAGGYWASGVLIDGHCEPVEEGSWSLLSKLSQRARVKASILEHDANFPDLSVLLAQVARARTMISPLGSGLAGPARDP
ncbi:hypothetical protein BE08_05000 [Sorangium cellulosum]|uniref:Uncharacterized protein n=1 Tax=Sorangium cellulosum TaxID=56 RepID=A0A150PK75_SORCE|nr:hypothetical protein BE08_05000 [Sorangium cellulosum]